MEMEKRAQQHVYRLNPQTLSQFEIWVTLTKQRWEERFAVFDIVFEREKKQLVKENKKAGDTMNKNEQDTMRKSFST